MRVLVTGATGYMGGLLIPALLDDPRIDHVRGTDLVPAGRRLPEHYRYQHVVCDVATANAAAIEDLLDGVDVVIHLAFRSVPFPGEAPRAIRRQAEEQFLTRLSGSAKRLVVVSSASVYGHDASRDPLDGRLPEDATLAPTQAADEALQQTLEGLLDRLEVESTLAVVRVRPALLVGPGVEKRRMAPFTAPVLHLPQTSPSQRIQLLHEADFVRGMRLLLEAAPGAYNMAPDDCVSLEGAAAMLGQRVTTTQGWLMKPLLAMSGPSARLYLDGRWLPFFESPPPLLANDKLKRLGWAPQHNTGETLRHTIEALRGPT